MAGRELTLRRVWITKTLLVGSLAALVFGGALATLAASSKEKVKDDPIAVPVGHVGDQVVYAFFAGGPEAEGDWSTYGVRAVGVGVLSKGREPQAFDDLRPMGARAFEVETVVSAFDAAHHRHDAVVVLHNETLPDYPAFFYQVAEHVDLEKRVVFRIDENAVIEGKGGDKSTVAPGEASGNVQSSSFALAESLLPGLAHQGLTLQLGQVLREGDPEIPAAFQGVVVQAHEKEWVESRAVIEGHDAYAIRYEVTYRAIGPALAAADSTTDANDPGRPVEFHVQAWRVDWMTADLPYAVLRETGLEFEHGGQRESAPATAYKFERLLPGASFIPWRSDGALHWAAERTDHAKSDPGPPAYPDDGGSSLGYKLHEAAANADADATLLPFHLWKQSHAGYVVAGASYFVPGGGASIRVHQWRLLFATENGDAYEVWSERTEGANAATQNRDRGAKNVPVFEMDDWPATPPTVAALEATWRDYVSADARARLFNYVRWGYDLTGQNGSCSSGIEVRAGARDAQLFQYFEGGHSEQAGCPAMDAAATFSSGLVMEATTARVVSVYESQMRYGLAGRNTAFDPAMRDRWQRAASTVPAGLEAPGPAQTAGASAGALAIFLAAYFWPIVKFAGAKLAFVAGYAKIAKEDLLNNPVRDGILQLIRNSPGIHASDIARQANAGWGTIVYHLGVLERNKMVTSLVDGRHKRFFPADTVDYGKRGQLAALMNANTKTIYELIEGAPGIVQGELAGRTGLTIPTVIWHLQRLEQAGLVGRDRDGRKFHYFANPVYQPKQAAPESMEVQ